MGSRAGLVFGLIVACLISIALGVFAVMTNEEEGAPSATPSPGELTEPPITAIVTTPPTTPPITSSPTAAATPTQSPTPFASPTPEPTETPTTATAMTGGASSLVWLGMVVGLIGLILIRSLRSA